MKENRTNSGPRSVARSFDNRPAIRACLADLLGFVRHDRAWPDNLEGNISDWLISIHGIQRGEPETAAAHPSIDFNQIFGNLDELCAILQDVRSKSPIRRYLEEMGSQEGPKILAARRSGDKRAEDAALARAMTGITGVVGLPRNFPTQIGADSFSGFTKLLRATRVMLVSMALFHEHPLSLIAQASRGDRRAALQLVKVDHMFFYDECCKAIRKAALQDDSRFMAQVERALRYKRRIRLRELFHFYLYNLFLLEHFGLKLPAVNRLLEILDPVGREYGSLQAFERDVLRRRADFNKIIEAGKSAAILLADIPQKPDQ